MDGLAIRVRNALEEDSTKGFLIGHGFIDKKMLSASVQPSLDSHGDLVEELQNDFDYDSTKGHELRKNYRTLVENYSPNKRKISLQRERTYSPQAILESEGDSNFSAKPDIEMFRFSKNGVNLNFAYTFHHRTEALIISIESNQEDLKQEIEKSLSILPQNTPLTKRLDVVYQQLLSYVPLTIQNSHIQIR